MEVNNIMIRIIILLELLVIMRGIGGGEWRNPGDLLDQREFCFQHEH